MNNFNKNRNDDYQPKKVKRYEPIIEENENDTSPRRVPNGRSMDEVNSN
jgi:hypothetical protein